MKPRVTRRFQVHFPCRVYPVTHLGMRLPAPGHLQDPVCEFLKAAAFRVGVGFGGIMVAVLAAVDVLIITLNT